MQLLKMESTITMTLSGFKIISYITGEYLVFCLDCLRGLAGCAE